MSGPQPPSTPHSLLGRMLQGGPNGDEAWREFVQRYGPLVAAWCLGRGLQTSDAEDVIQEVLLRLFRYLRSYNRTQGRFRDWLCAMTRNVTNDFQKKEQDRATVQFLEGVAEPPARESLGEQLEQQFQREILTEARERVRPRCKERDWILFCRLTDEDLNSADAAREYGVTVGTIYKLKHAVSTQLRQEIARLEEEGFDAS